MLIGPPSIDPIIARDERHSEMMRLGSLSLLHAIQAHRSNTLHGFTRREPMWLMPFDKAKREVRQAANDGPVAGFRDPCVRCGVRYDNHHTGGCASYQRARVA